MTDPQRRSRRRRRLAGGPAWSPAGPTAAGYTPEHWFRADGPLWQDAGSTPAIADGAVVGRWEDKATAADHANQATGDNMPTLQLAELAGMPVIRFDGSNDYLQGAFTNGGSMAQPNTVFAVAKLTAAGVNDGVWHYLMSGDDASARHDLRTNIAGTPDPWGLFAGVALDGAASNASWNIWTVTFNGATSRFWHNGVAQCAAGNAGAHAMDGITIGDRYDLSGHWLGDIAEIIIYEENLSSADKNQVGRYLANRYGLAYTEIA